MALNPKDIYQKLQERFAREVTVFEEESKALQVSPEGIREVALHLRDEEAFAFDFLMCLSGVDYADGNLGVVYHLYSMRHGHSLALKVKIPTENPSVPSVEKIWRTADWHEREAFDLLGIIFEGHSDLRRILCPYDWEGYPLRKDYKQPEYYQGMKVPY